MASDLLAKVNFLIVDDHAITQKLIGEILRSFGAVNIETATDGTNALEVMRTYKPDIAIVDWQMTPMDGVAFTRYIRTDKKSPDVFLPIIMMTGVGAKDQVVTAREAGVNEYVVKPITAKALITRILAVAEKPRQFVRLGAEYFGPDRRRKKKAFEGDSKRGLAKQEAVKMPRLALQPDAAAPKRGKPSKKS